MWLATSYMSFTCPTLKIHPSCKRNAQTTSSFAWQTTMPLKLNHSQMKLPKKKKVQQDLPFIRKKHIPGMNPPTSCCTTPFWSNLCRKAWWSCLLTAPKCENFTGPFLCWLGSAHSLLNSSRWTSFQRRSVTGRPCGWLKTWRRWAIKGSQELWHLLRRINLDKALDGNRDESSFLLLIWTKAYHALIVNWNPLLPRTAVRNGGHSLLDSHELLLANWHGRHSKVVGQRVVGLHFIHQANSTVRHKYKASVRKAPSLANTLGQTATVAPWAAKAIHWAHLRPHSTIAKRQPQFDFAICFKN